MLVDIILSLLLLLLLMLLLPTLRSLQHFRGIRAALMGASAADRNGPSRRHRYEPRGGSSRHVVVAIRMPRGDGRDMMDDSSSSVVMLFVSLLLLVVPPLMMTLRLLLLLSVSSSSLRRISSNAISNPVLPSTPHRHGHRRSHRRSHRRRSSNDT